MTQERLRELMRERVSEVAEEGILVPVAAELEAVRALCSALAVARGERQRLVTNAASYASGRSG